jgi:DnaJ family protein C protein 13
VITEKFMLRSILLIMFMIQCFAYRAVVPTQSNVIEAGPDMMRESEGEWHYSCSGDRKGPVSFQEVGYVYVVLRSGISPSESLMGSQGV